MLGKRTATVGALILYGIMFIGCSKVLLLVPLKQEGAVFIDFDVAKFGHHLSFRERAAQFQKGNLILIVGSSELIDPNADSVTFRLFIRNSGSDPLLLNLLEPKLICRRKGKEAEDVFRVNYVTHSKNRQWVGGQVPEELSSIEVSPGEEFGMGLSFPIKEDAVKEDMWWYLLHAEKITLELAIEDLTKKKKSLFTVDFKVDK